MFWRLIGTYGVLTVAAITLLGFVLERRVERHEQQLIEKTLQTRLVRVDIDLRGIRDPAQLQKRIDEMIEVEPGLRITLLREDGEVLADTAEEADRLVNHATRQEIVQARTQAFGSHIRRSSSIDKEMIYVAKHRENPEGPVAFVRVALALDQVAEPLADLRRLVTTSAALAAGLTLILTAWFSRRIARPIQEVAQAAERIAAGDYGQKVYASGQSEVVRLARSFNNMSERLEEQITKLEDDQEQLRAILSGMVEGVVALDAEQRILFVNERARQLLEFATPSPVGRKLWDVVRQRSLLDVVQRALTEREPQRVELNWHGLTQRSLTVHAARLPGEIPRGAVLVIHDTTDLRRLERLRSEFVANVSHELKTPLTVIKTCMETLLEGGAAEDPNHRRTFLEQVSDQANRLHYLIVDMLSLARIEAGTEVFDFREVALAEAVELVCDRQRARAESRNQTLAIEGSDDVVVWADEEAVFQILDNLIDNALKYTPVQGRIQVRWWAEGQHGCVEVRDTGIGIPAQDLPRIFERFYRVDKARSREMGGTGLGLSIVKHLVQAMHGSISAVSQVNEGTTFTVRLPQPVETPTPSV